jgi:7-cyano-7-deazaguanine synthase in queuosine biosynthesis
MDVIHFVGAAGCGDRAYRDGLQDRSVAVIDTLSAERNVTVQFRRDGRLVRVPMQDDVCDLVDLAVTVYIADELLKREHSDDGWTRDFRLILPVREPKRWQDGSLMLKKTVSFLSQDRSELEFLQRKGSPRLVRHRAVLPSGFDAVCLFSGGIDSLLGAHELLRQGRKVILMGHQADPVTAAAQKAIAAELARRFPNATTLVQCRVARAKNEKPKFLLPNKVEESHRPRSFLFLALAVAVARAATIKEVYIPENGFIALNPPLQISRIGSHSTRTAHPIFLSRYVEFLHSSGLFDGSIRNPFLYQSKTDMLLTLDPTLIQLVLRSVSCSHPSRYQDEGVRHCGYCVPCLYRRAAMMSCGLDRLQDYAYDVFTTSGSIRRHQPLTAYKQTDIRALVPFAERIVHASTIELEKLVLSHGYFPPDVGRVIGQEVTTDYRAWTDMLRRWAEHFMREIPPRCDDGRRAVYGVTPTGSHVP